MEPTRELGETVLRYTRVHGTWANSGPPPRDVVKRAINVGPSDAVPLADRTYFYDLIWRPVPQLTCCGLWEGGDFFAKLPQLQSPRSGAHLMRPQRVLLLPSALELPLDIR